MEKLLKVRCGNPYFKGELEGVQFQQATGGAVGMATQSQAEAIIRKKNFSCPELADAPPRAKTLEDVKGIGPKTSDKLEDVGINSLKQLIEADPDATAEAIDEKVDQVTDWQAQAKELLTG